MSEQFLWSPDVTSQRLSAIEKQIETGQPELRSVFTQTFFEDAHLQLQKLSEAPALPLHGTLVSIKDLFDVKGYVTKAGTKFMATDAPAENDAPAINNLRNAGAVFVGHTNMTELAYSGLGLNPHYGTPENALLPGHIPGGSTSGGAVSVALGVADIAIGTDTGGSLRIPAAFNGIVGFKPSQRTVSRVGCKALSRTLDSVGPMARTVEACTAAYKALAGDLLEEATVLSERFVIPNNYGMDGLEPEVQEAFEAAVLKLKAAGFEIEERELPSLENLKSLPIWHFSAIESRGEYDKAYQEQRELIDPRIASAVRMGRADEVNAVAYRKTLNQREALVVEYRREMDCKILLLPTTPIMPPSFASMEDDAEYSRMNLLALRNPTIGNIMDCCSISLPYKHQRNTVGIMFTATAGYDLSLLELANRVEGIFSTHS